MADRPGRVATDSDEFRISGPAARAVSVPLLDQRPVVPVPIEAISQAALQAGLELGEARALLLGID